MHNKKKVPYLGKVFLNWCNECNIPLLEKNPCEICGKLGKSVPISPPGDIRPAFDGDRILISSVIDSIYGSKVSSIVVPSDKIILLNKIGGIDRNEELIVDGFVIGLFLYNPLKLHYEFHPNLIGAKYIFFAQKQLGLPYYKSITLNSLGLPFILKGKSVLAPGVINCSNDICDDDYCIILYSENETTYCIASAIAQGSSQIINKMLEDRKGYIAKTRDYDEKLCNFSGILKSGQNFDTIYHANANFLKMKINTSIEFIQTTIKKQNLPVGIGYSGGKDSLAVLMLVWKAIGNNFKIFFADTGLEFPEVKENVNQIVKLLHMENNLLLRNAGEKFWDLIKTFGPPGRDYRFCCHTLKAQQITDIIHSLYDGQKVLVFLGIRQYESLNRAKERRVYVNSFIPLQVAATPIKDWNALTLWLFLLKEKITDPENQREISLPITDLYFKGYERLGCYLCPAQSLNSFENLKKTHPQLHDKWYTYLNEYAEINNLPPFWVNFGLWRYKSPPPVWVDVLKHQNLEWPHFSPTQSKDFSFFVSKGFSPCLNGGFSIKGKFSIPLDLDKVRLNIRPYSENIIFEEDIGVLSIQSRFKSTSYHLNLFSDGSLTIQSQDQELEYTKLLEYLMTTISKTIMCNLCKTCEKICPNHAITEENHMMIIDESICSECLNCISHCPLMQISRNKISSDEVKKTI